LRVSESPESEWDGELGRRARKGANSKSAGWSNRAIETTESNNEIVEEGGRAVSIQSSKKKEQFNDSQSPVSSKK
jgi:hypothetical protein